MYLSKIAIDRSTIFGLNWPFRYDSTKLREKIPDASTLIVARSAKSFIRDCNMDSVIQKSAFNVLEKEPYLMKHKENENTPSLSCNWNFPSCAFIISATSASSSRKSASYDIFPEVTERISRSSFSEKWVSPGVSSIMYSVLFEEIESLI